MTEQNNTNTVVFGLKNLKDVAVDYTVPAGMRECKIRIKSAVNGKAIAGQEGKVSQYCDLPVVSDNFVQSFILKDKGMDLVRGYIESLQDDAVRSCYLKNSRSPIDSDLSIDALIEIGCLTSTTVRLTKETVGAWFEAKKGAIAFYLATKLYGEDKVAEGEFWNTAEGEKALQFAANYKSHFIDLAGKAPSYLPAVKQKLELVAVSIMEGSVLEEKMLEKLANAVEKTADDLGI